MVFLTRSIQAYFSVDVPFLQFVCSKFGPFFLGSILWWLYKSSPSLKREWLTDYMHTSFIVVEIQKYLEYINTLEYEDQPDYEFIRKLFREGLKKRGCTDDGKNVKFTTSKASSASADLPNGYSSAGEVCMLLLILILSGEILSWALVGVKGFATNSL